MSIPLSQQIEQLNITQLLSEHSEIESKYLDDDRYTDDNWTAEIENEFLELKSKHNKEIEKLFNQAIELVENKYGKNTTDNYSASSIARLISDLKKDETLTKLKLNPDTDPNRDVMSVLPIALKSVNKEKLDQFDKEYSVTFDGVTGIGGPNKRYILYLPTSNIRYGDGYSTESLKLGTNPDTKTLKDLGVSSKDRKKILEQIAIVIAYEMPILKTITKREFNEEIQVTLESRLPVVKNAIISNFLAINFIYSN